MSSVRQTFILEYLAQHGEGEVEQLSQLLGVSPSTVRRELRLLQENGLLERTHGAAHLPSPVRYEPPYESRAAANLDAKRAIATAARRLVRPGAVVGLSGGTTCTELARQLRSAEQLTIVTNAVNIALELQGQSRGRVMMTGGLLNQNSYELVGNRVAESLQNIHLDITFLGASGIDSGFGISMSDEPEAAVGRAFRAAAERSVVLADHSKIGRRTFARLCHLNEIDLLITDGDAASEELSILQHAGLKVLLADAGPHPI
jgi:DeoR family transcriptional regulator, aga operon transcriptional repressor